jgi:hypothetical protein
MTQSLPLLIFFIESSKNNFLDHTVLYINEIIATSLFTIYYYYPPPSIAAEGTPEEVSPVSGKLMLG